MQNKTFDRDVAHKPQATNHKPHSGRRRGFTLIELLVVILILAILAAIIVPRVINRTGDAKRSRAVTDLATLSAALQTYRLDNDSYPTTEEGLQSLRQAPSSAQNWRGPYIERLSPDPWGYNYIYETPGPDGEDSFLLLSYGRDGQPGGTGEDADVTQGNEEEQFN